MAFYKALGWKTGVTFIILGSILIAAGIVLGQLLIIGLKQGLFDYPIYKEEKKFKDPAYEKCENKTTTAWFFNLTNADALKTGAETKPHYHQVGPYNFTREECEFGNYAEGDWEYYRAYWKEGYLEAAADGLTADDMIVNFNPAYLGIMKKIEEQTGSGDNLELGLVAQMTGPGLMQVIQGLQSNAFTQQVKIGAIPTFLTTVRSTAIPQFEASVRALTDIGYIVNFLSNIPAPNMTVATDLFFNDVNIGGSVANFTGVSLAYSAASQNLILHGTGVPPQPLGWLTETQQGLGLLGFLQAASDTGVSGQYMTAAQLNANQMNALLAFAGYLFNTVAENLGGGVSGIHDTALDAFYTQWTTSTIPLDLDQNPATTPDGFEVGTNYTTGTITPVPLTLATCEGLWNETDPQSLTNPLTGMPTWFGAAQAFQGGNTAPATALMAKFGIASPVLIGALFQYLSNLETYVMGPVLMVQFGVPSLDKLAYLQWGSEEVLLGHSAAEYDPSIPAPPEFADFTKTHGAPSVKFNATFSEQLLNSTNGFFDGVNIGKFLALYQYGQTTAIQAIWGLDSTQAQLMAGYLLNFAGVFVEPLLTTQLFPLGSGPIVASKPVEWLWTASDPLLSFIGFPSNVGMLYDSFEALNRSQAEAQSPMRSRSIFRGGSKAERTDSQAVKRYPDYPPGNATVEGIWSGPLPVEGNYQGVYWPPGVSKEDTLTLWLDQVIRPMDFQFWKKNTVKGIPVYLFKAVEATFEANPFYYQPEGLLNLSSAKPAKVFLSRPHFYGISDATVHDGILGLDPTDPAYGNQYFAVEPESGFGMLRVAPFQINFQIPAMNRYYTGLNESRFVPVLHSDYRLIIGDDDAKEFKKLVNGLKAGSLAAYIVGIVLGALMLGFGIFVCVHWNLRRSRGDESNIEVELPSK